MPRVGRVVLQNYPHHVVQRGHNKQVVFSEEDDYRYFLCTLEEYKDLYDVKVFGFCLMTNHVHLILQPGETISGLGQLIKRLAGRKRGLSTVRNFALGRFGKVDINPAPSRLTPTYWRVAAT